MSASLVGSEMCIRDSHKSDAGGHRRLDRAPLPGVGVPTPGHAGAEGRGCLLYTSDAATICSV
eukprot:11043379-Alexandrium_andersonii.AAC.1